MMPRLQKPSFTACAFAKEAAVMMEVMMEVFSSKSRRDSFSFFFISSSTNSLESSPTSELDRVEQEGAPSVLHERARGQRRISVNQKSEADEKAAVKKARMKNWRDNKLKKNPDYFKEKKKDWRGNKMEKNPDYFKEERPSY